MKFGTTSREPLSRSEQDTAHKILLQRIESGIYDSSFLTNLFSAEFDQAVTKVWANRGFPVNGNIIGLSQGTDT